MLRPGAEGIEKKMLFRHTLCFYIQMRFNYNQALLSQWFDYFDLLYGQSEDFFDLATNSNIFVANQVHRYLSASQTPQQVGPSYDAEDSASDSTPDIVRSAEE